MIRTLVAVLGLAYAMTAGVAAHAAPRTYGWSFTVTAVSDGFNAALGLHLGQTLGSGTLTVADGGTPTSYNDGFTDYPVVSRAVIGITGTFDGAAIIGLAADGTTGIGGFVADNSIATLTDGTGFVLSPNGNLLLSLNRAIDGASQIALQADNFQWGGFVDTAGGNEWQGDFTLTPDAASAVPEPASVILFGAGLFGLYGVGRRGTIKAIRSSEQFAPQCAS